MSLVAGVTLELESAASTAAGRFDDLKEALTDVLYVGAKCASGLVYDLCRDYLTAWEALPESQSERQSLAQHEQQVTHYCRELLTFARAHYEARRNPPEPAQGRGSRVRAARPSQLC